MRMIRGPRKSTILPQTGPEAYPPLAKNIKNVVGMSDCKDGLPLPAKPTMLSEYEKYSSAPRVVENKLWLDTFKIRFSIV